MSEASLLGPRLKLERAKKHLDDLVLEIKGFFETNPYEGVIQDNPETGKREFKVTRADPLPDSFSVISGDVVHNLRSALDHIIWQLVIANGKQPKRNTAFPIWGGKPDFVSGRPGYAKGISKEALNVLYGLKPYKGGNDALWRIHKLDIVDKHRLLLAVATRHESLLLDFGEIANKTMEQAGIAQPDKLPSMILPLIPEEREIIEVGSVLFATEAGDEAHDDVKANFEIAFHEPEIPVSEPLAKTLHELFRFVDEALSLFAPLIR